MRFPVRSLLRWSPLILFGATLVIFLVLFFRFQRKPEIIGLDRLTAGPGDRIEITGRFFGDGSDGAKLFVGSHALTSTGILEWNDRRIIARVPRSDGAVLVRVKTRSGTSRGAILGDSDRFPQVDYGAWLPGAPYIEYAEPPVGVPGDLITFHGTGFGDRRGSGRIWMNRSDEVSMLGMEEPDLDLYVEAHAIDSWTNTMVRFRMPQGARGGNAYLFRSGAFSNPVSVEMGDVPGRIQEGEPVQWSLRQDVVIDRVGAYPGNGLFLRIPRPEAGLGQGDAVVIAGVGPEGTPALRTDGNLSLYRLDELESGRTARIGRQLVVSVRPVRALVTPQALLGTDPTHPELAAALGNDDWIKPDTVAQVAARAAGGTRDDWSRARSVYDYVTDLLAWDEEPPTRVVSEYIRSGAADSEGYAFLYCSLARAVDLPARPVGGLIILPDGTTRSWWWAEFWITGLGWIPVDPALGDGADGILLPGGPQDPSLSLNYYFGGLEARHIAFSRGIAPARPQQPEIGLNIPSDRYSLQDVWEEVTGNLETYDSHWPVPRVTSVYSGG